jgi:hypothetical protein
MNDLRDLLTRARDLIANEEHFTQGTYARGSSGRAVDIRSRYAVRRCAMGAVYCSGSRSGQNQASLNFAARDALISAGIILYGFPTIERINDRLGHAAVLRCFDLAIERAE